VLIAFTSDADASPDRLVMRQELEVIFGRKVDLVYRRVVEHDSNYLLRKAVLRSARVIYAT
jgi:predicted nucleotidyltransferase